MNESNLTKQLAKHLYYTLLLLFFIGILPFSAKAQEYEYAPSTGIRIAYMGPFLYPGFNIGLERPYKVTKVDKVQSNETKIFYKERNITYNFGMYSHQNFHTNFLLQVEWVIRRQYSKGLFLQSNFGTGLSKTFLAGATYQVSNNGEIKKVPMAGNFYGLLNMGGSIGYNLYMKGKQPVSFYFKPDLVLLMPYNRFIMPTITFEVGAICILKNFWKANPKNYYSVKNKKGAKTN